MACPHKSLDPFLSDLFDPLAALFKPVYDLFFFLASKKYETLAFGTALAMNFPFFICLLFGAGSPTLLSL